MPARSRELEERTVMLKVEVRRFPRRDIRNSWQDQIRKHARRTDENTLSRKVASKKPSLSAGKPQGNLDNRSTDVLDRLEPRSKSHHFHNNISKDKR